MNKQIEEMARCSDCIHYSVCSLWSTSDLEKDEAHKYCFGNFKSAADYRKTSDVVREIFERLHAHRKNDGHTVSVWENDLICIAKEYGIDLLKYTESEGEK